MSKVPPSDLPTHSFPSASEFEDFLENEHATAPGIYLKLAKKSSGIKSISAPEAVEVALCFGWIDGRADKFDDEWWLVRYTPRRSKSIWSQKNVNTISRLIEQDRMRPAGLAAVEAAKADGRWERAYAGPATITVPDDLSAVLATDSAAAAFFEGLNKSERYAVLWRIETASRTNRAKRIEALVQALAAGKRPGAPAKSAEKSSKTSTQKVIKKPKAPRNQARTKKQPESASLISEDPSGQPRREGLRSRR